MAKLQLSAYLGVWNIEQGTRNKEPGTSNKEWGSWMMKEFFSLSFVSSLAWRMRGQKTYIGRLAGANDILNISFHRASDRSGILFCEKICLFFTTKAASQKRYSGWHGPSTRREAPKWSNNNNYTFKIVQFRHSSLYCFHVESVLTIAYLFTGWTRK